ncbi:efflux RND transporter periplasmic adaptor subunit [Pusillimonas caeni]|uniref:efflux RND transporter periplasmic adaptor subunit n=1 Tax=Pusillimonas caeni TaxID=1348472 RepID=UPI000E59F2A3|nr:efflux RND transporter periplasmic adaptor subunit [Pusillimonas caeni]TFL11248.1 efflux RND transporter periplasmic adaptor subunit [Pusillimonas caeni]
MNRSTVVRGLAAASAVCAVMLAACTPGAEDGGWLAAKVALATVERAAAPRALHGVGELEAVRQVELASEASGRIARIVFESGQQVAKGQLLVQVDDAPEQAERLRLRAQLRNAEAALARTRRLLADKVANQEQLDNALATRDMARGALQGIEAMIAQKAITAPFSGVIGIRRVHEGHYLRAGETIASLVDAGTLHVNFALDEGAASRLHPGQPLEVKVDAWPQRSFVAQVAAIDPLIDKSRQLRVQARLSNVEGLLQAGMFAGIRLLREQSPSVLAVPETAVTYASYGQMVFVAESDGRQGLKARRVAVKTGERWDGRVEIVSGLEEGERVVVSGQIKLADGMALEPAASDALSEETPDAGQARGSTA